MGIFSEALAELDRNTVDYMIDELKRENEQLQGKMEQIQEQELLTQEQAILVRQIPTLEQTIAAQEMQQHQLLQLRHLYWFQIQPSSLLVQTTRLTLQYLL